MLNLIKKFIRLIIGEPWDNRDYKKMMKRVRKLPKDYQYVFHKIKHYMYVNCVDPYGELAIFTDLLDLFETSAAEGKHVLEVIGNDVGEFCNEIIRTSAVHGEFQKMWGNINKEIMEKFNKEGK